MDHDQPGLLSRWVRGDPPAQHAVDMYQRYGIFAAWLMGLVSAISGTIGLIAPAGLILASIGVLIFTNHQGLRDRMWEREERSWALRITQVRQATKFGALLLTIIGVIWFAIGAAELLDAL